MGHLLKLRPYLRPYYHLILISFLLAIPLSALRAAPAPLVKHLTDKILVERDARKLTLFPLLFIGIYLANFVVRFLHYYLMRVVIARVNQRLKNSLFEHLMGLSADYYTTQSTGTMISRVASDTQLIDGGLSALNTIIREPITFLAVFAYAFRLNWKLTLLTLIIFPPLALIFSITSRNLKRYIAGIADANAAIYSTLQESFSGFRVIKLFQLERYSRKKFRERSERFSRTLLKTAALEEVSHPMVELLTAGLIAVVVFLGGKLVLKNEMTPGELFGFFLSFALMMNPIRLMNDVNMKLSQASAACQRVFEVFEWKPRLAEADVARPFKEFTREIELDQVSFRYPDAPNRTILKNVSFKIPKGRTVALVGASGAGKSSLVNLLPRVFDVTGGAIRIDGTDIRELSLEDLRRQIAVVSQDVFLFNDTIEENIRCGRLGASREQIREAARLGHALEFIEKQPEGFATMIGDRGQRLSGGQRQRLSIARAFLRQAPILILDEATSSLDSASERAVQEALEDLMRDRTTLIIAHRLSSIRDASEIVVLKHGEVVERGSHVELVGKLGEYARIHEANV